MDRGDALALAAAALLAVAVLVVWAVARARGEGLTSPGVLTCRAVFGARPGAACGAPPPDEQARFACAPQGGAPGGNALLRRDLAGAELLPLARGNALWRRVRDTRLAMLAREGTRGGRARDDPRFDAACDAGLGCDGVVLGGTTQLAPSSWAGGAETGALAPDAFTPGATFYQPPRVDRGW